MKKGLLCVFLLALCVPCAYADRGIYDPYHDPAEKLSYGVGDASVSWANVPLAMGHYAEEYDPVTGAIVGIPVGTMVAVKECVEGTVNATFFFAPPFEREHKKKRFLHTLHRWDEQIKEKFW
ncbi:MAG: hypothetical protein GF333_04510 [Candidatus Omnitrophica bacterium]|nr:hypothetical protein [Candidatus Omnitrophota bacterium]